MPGDAIFPHFSQTISSERLRERSHPRRPVPYLILAVALRRNSEFLVFL